MEQPEFERLYIDSKPVFHLELACDQGPRESCLSSWLDDVRVRDVTISIDADALQKAVRSFMQAKDAFYSVAVQVYAQSKTYQGNFCASKVFLYWDVGMTSLNCEFETSDEDTGAVFWLDLTSYFPLPLTEVASV